LNSRASPPLSDRPNKHSNPFDASAVAGLAAGNAADRTAKATEDTAKEVKQIRRNGAIAFT
jgi:hypothetical protein